MSAADRIHHLELQARERQDYINQLEQKATLAWEESTRIILEREDEIRHLQARIAELEESK